MTNTNWDEELRKENKALAHLGPNHKRRRKIHVALENTNVDFNWDENEVYGVIAQWEEGRSIEYMAESFQRPPRDVFVLLFDLAERNKIKARPGSIYGFWEVCK